MSSPQYTKERTFVVVGASTGLGRETARRLAREHRVIAAGRDVAVLREAVPDADHARVDLASLADVARFCDELPQRVDGLVCNAGVPSPLGPPVFTRDGYEVTFVVNHLAHFAIATRLGPRLRRVVFVGSATHSPTDRGSRMFGYRGGRYQDAPTLAAGLGDPSATDAQRTRDRYATSKLCNLLTVAAFVRRGIDAYAFDPGLMPGTGLARDRSLAFRIGWQVMRVLALGLPRVSSARRSGKALAWLVSDYAGPDRYVDYRRRAVEPSVDARRTDLSDELYRGSLALIAAATMAGHRDEVEPR